MPGTVARRACPRYPPHTPPPIAPPAMRTDPVLPSADLNDTVDFYTSLGFELGYDDREGDGYVILGMDGAFIHFFYHDSLDATGSDAGCYLHVDDAHALHRGIVRRASLSSSSPDEARARGAPSRRRENPET